MTYNDMMKVVRRDLEVVKGRLEALGYDFTRYPKGESVEYLGEPLGPVWSEDEISTIAARIAANGGKLPVALEAFFRHVGTVTFRGSGPGWGEYLDPLEFDVPPRHAHWLLDEWESDGDPDERGLSFEFGGDFVTKSHYSGGSYEVSLADGQEDPSLLGLDTTLTEYLRHAILEWGGFPGASGESGFFQYREPLVAETLEAIRSLAIGLEPF